MPAAQRRHCQTSPIFHLLHGPQGLSKRGCPPGPSLACACAAALSAAMRRGAVYADRCARKHRKIIKEEELSAMPSPTLAALAAFKPPLSEPGQSADWRKLVRRHALPAHSSRSDTPPLWS